MHKPAFVSSFVNKVAALYGQHPGKMLIHTGVIGWVLSSAAQVCAIVFNEKIPKEQKMFLIPQELSDALVNIVSFYFITQGFKSVGSKLVDTGRWVPKAVKDFVVYKGYGDKLGQKGFSIFKDGILSPSGIKRAKSFKNGIDVLFTTLGSVISCNLVTPIFRNKIAAYKQKESIAKMKESVDVSNIHSDKKSLALYNRPTMLDFQSGAYSKYGLYPNNSMKI